MDLIFVLDQPYYKGNVLLFGVTKNIFNKVCPFVLHILAAQK